MKKLLLALIRFYQKYVSPAFPPRCRFMPTCSQYAAQAIEKYGALKGGRLMISLIPFRNEDPNARRNLCHS